MRLFLVTHQTKFNGTLELVYGDNEQLLRVILDDAIISQETLRQLLTVMPLTIAILLGSFKNGGTIIEKDYIITFDEFWNAYDKKINKKRVQPLWDKLKTPLKIKAFTGIKKYDAYLSRPDVNWRSKADPETYLRNEMWDNIYE
jgi:hypothetical protein